MGTQGILGLREHRAPGVTWRVFKGLQGYLAHKKHPPPGTLLKEDYLGSYGGAGGVGDLL